LGDTEEEEERANAAKRVKKGTTQRATKRANDAGLPGTGGRVKNNAGEDF
jgi:hypothetical protein